MGRKDPSWWYCRASLLVGASDYPMIFREPVTNSSQWWYFKWFEIRPKNQSFPTFTCNRHFVFLQTYRNVCASRLVQMTS